MAKEFKKLLGNRVYLELPPEPKSDIILDEASKEALEKERLKKYGRLRVYAVGDGIKPDENGIILKEGDEVMLDPTSVANAVKIPLSDTKEVVLVSMFNIAHIW